MVRLTSCSSIYITLAERTEPGRPRSITGRCLQSASLFFSCPFLRTLLNWRAITVLGPGQGISAMNAWKSDSIEGFLSARHRKPPWCKQNQNVKSQSKTKNIRSKPRARLVCDLSCHKTAVSKTRAIRGQGIMGYQRWRHGAGCAIDDVVISASVRSSVGCLQSSVIILSLVHGRLLTWSPCPLDATAAADDDDVIRNSFTL